MTIYEGLTVVEVPGNGASSWTGKHFADWGARVVLLEPHGGCDLRSAPPYYEHDGARRSALWSWLSHGKSVTGSAIDESARRELCARADVLLLDQEALGPTLGMALTDVATAFAAVPVVLIMTPFGTTGPYAGYRATDIGLSARGGWLSAIGDPGKPPLRAGADIIARVAGMAGFVAAQAALRITRAGGPPQRTELSGQAIAASLHPARWMIKSFLGEVENRQRYSWPYSPQKAKDGYVGIPPLTAQQWESILLMLGLGHLLEDPKVLDIQWRLAHQVELQKDFDPWVAERTKYEVFMEAQEWRIPSAPVNTVADRLDDPQLADRNYYRTREVDGLAVKVPRVPYLVEIEPPALDAAQETDHFELPAGPRPGPVRPAGRPLEGLRVLDLTVMWAGAAVTMNAGALGADVIKVEAIQKMDPYRVSAARTEKQTWEKGGLWHDTNCNKRGLTLDLTSAEGKRLFFELAKQADIVISNFSPRVMPNLGLSAKDLLPVNPRLIVVTMPGFGRGGPYEEFVGYGTSFEYMSVSASVTDYEGGPGRESVLSDPTAGYYALAAILVALRRRDQTGEGLGVEIAQTEQIDSLYAPEWIAVQHGAPVPAPMGNKHAWMAPHDVYRAAGEGDNWVAIAISTDGEFRALTKVLGLEGLSSDPRFATAAERKAHEAALDPLIADAVRAWDRDELERTLQAVGVMACRLTLSSDLPEDDAAQEFGYFQMMDRAVTGPRWYRTLPFKFEGVDLSNVLPPPLLGEHTAEVLREVLGLDEAACAKLQDDRVTGTVPVGWDA